MEEQRALADTKARVVSAQRDVTVAEQEARAAVARADGEAGAIRKIAEANAARETLVGMAQAGVLEAKVSAIGRDNWTTMEVITNLAEQHVPIVPQVVAGSGDGAGGGNVAGALLGVLAAKMFRPEMPVPPAPPSDRLLVDSKRKRSAAGIADQPGARMGAHMVREVASKTSDNAGDGTTTATVLTASVIRRPQARRGQFRRCC